MLRKMKRYKLLLIILLIVGCAPTKPSTSTFYIGMTEEDFKVKNPELRPIYEDINSSSKIGRILFNEVYYHEKEEKIISMLFFGAISDYYFYFKNDTLLAVYYGGLNADIKREIDYSIYPNAKP